jgi:hypothetical protein
MQQRIYMKHKFTTFSAEIIKSEYNVFHTTSIVSIPVIHFTVLLESRIYSFEWQDDWWMIWKETIMS